MSIARPAESQFQGSAPARTIARGYFRILNLFDIADAIDLEKLRVLIGPQATPRSPAFLHLTPEYAQAQNPPIEESLEPVTLPSGEKLGARIKYFWFGVASVQLTTPFHCNLDSLCGDSYRWMNAPEVEKAAEDLLRARLQQLQSALVRPSSKWLDEDYLVIDIQTAEHEDGHTPTAEELIKCYGDQITELVRGEITPLSSTERDEILRGALSYYPTDLIVAGWAAALVYDKPDATSAIIDLLEYANTQLLEFRYYDEVLTSLLSNVYSSLEGQESFVSRWRLPRRAGRVNRLRLDIMDLAERTEYAVKFISDTYYARVYRVISSKIGVDDYKALVSEKLKTAGELYEFMIAQFNERRMFLLELVVAVLVALDVILLLRGNK
jgi:hypothetical protein